MKSYIKFCLISFVVVTAMILGSQPAFAAKNSKKTDKQTKKAEKTMMEIKLATGTVKIELYPQDAPKTVAQITRLANSGFYNGLKFHRVEPGFVVQGGDPTGTGGGGSGTKLPAEFNARKHLKGTVAMARTSDPNSADCQFYICLGPAPFLDRQYTVFGQVTEGQELVDKIKVGDLMTEVKVTAPAVAK